MTLLGWGRRLSHCMRVLVHNTLYTRLSDSLLDPILTSAARACRCAAAAPVALLGRGRVWGHCRGVLCAHLLLGELSRLHDVALRPGLD